MKNGTEKYIETVAYLGKLYDCANDEFFNGELVKPVITVQRDEKNKTYGWWSNSKVWKEDSADEGEHELNITAQQLSSPIAEIFATLIHEMCHQYATVNNLQDTSRSHIYHNKLFKKIAESHGLYVECVQTIGWSYTRLNEKAQDVLNRFLSQFPANIIYRLPVVKGQTVKTSSTRKYVCPICGQSIRATKAVNIICADCDEPMIEL